MKVYNKLVRDKIPEIIEADGKVCRTHILSNEEYIVALEAKLNEEVAEYQADKNLEEMAGQMFWKCFMQFAWREGIHWLN